MRKTLLTLGLILLSVAFVYGTADALVGGVCSDCHTMHNSQNGTNMAVGDDGSTLTTAQPYLTMSTCIGCHNGAVTAPNIFGATYGTNTTAGGSFDATLVVNASTTAKAHNVKDLVDAGMLSSEGTITSTPGNGSSPITVGPTALTCAGALGCHGDHDSANDTSAKGIKGFHHGSKDGYRFLQTTGNTPIAGKGSSDWEVGGANAINHNVYSAGGPDSISLLCAQCHGGFHGTGNTGSASPFTRHPTENVIPSSWDAIASITVDYNNNPFAFASADIGNVSTNSAYTATDYSPSVACVSCHRAHGTPYDDILRFDYTTAGTQKAGQGGDTGCLGCHTGQR